MADQTVWIGDDQRNDTPIKNTSFSASSLPDATQWPLGSQIYSPDYNNGVGAYLFSDGYVWNPVSANRNPEAKVVVIGDSQAGLDNSPVAITSYTYDSTTGVLTITAAGHGLVQGCYVGFQVRNRPEWNTYKTRVTFISSSVYSIIMPTGLNSFTASDARWFKFGTSTGQGISCWIRSLSNDSVNIIRNAGVTGETIPQIVARIRSEAISILSPGDCIIMDGGHNDLATTSDSAQTMYNNLIPGIQEAVRYGLRVIVINITPFGATYAVNNPVNRSRMCEYNRLISYLPSLYPGVAILNAYQDAVNTTLTTLSGTSGAGTAKANYVYSDFLHWSPITAKNIAKRAVNILNVWYPPQQTLITSGFDCYDATNNPLSTNLMQNGGLTTVTGGTVTGLLAGSVMGSQWTAAADANASSLTASVQQSSWGWGGNSAKIFIPDGLTFTNQRVRFLCASQQARFVPGQEFKFRGYFKTSGLAGLISFMGLLIYMQVDNGTSETVNAGLTFLNSSNQYYPNDSDFSGPVISGILKIPEGSTVTQLIWELNATINGTTSGTSYTEAGQISLTPI